MYPFTSLHPSLDESIVLLNRWGVVHVSSYLTSTETELLVQEFDTCFRHQADWLRPLNYSIGGGACITRSKIDPNILTTTAEIFSSPFMAELTDCYLGKPNLLNHEIYVVKDVVGSSHVAQDLHYDRIPTLKFFIYLTDTIAENGAFYCVPGSHTYTRTIQQQNRSGNFRPERDETRLIPPELASQVIPIEGVAGTLVIFHTDTLHRAGVVHRGERRVMRGHSRLPTYLDPNKSLAQQISVQRPLEAAKRSLNKLKKLVQPLRK